MKKISDEYRRFVEEHQTTINRGQYTYGDPIITGFGVVEIGNYTSIANNVNIILWGHRTDLFTTYPFGYSDETKDCPKPPELQVMDKVVIGNDVWIGSNTTIIYGSVIGDGAVIAAGSVVRGLVKPYSFIAGNPCERLYYRFNKETIDLLMDLKWWNLPYDIIKKNVDILASHDYNRLLEFYKRIKGL